MADLQSEQKDSESERPAQSPDCSLERRACRICQSETGDMLRPCGCAGTMGDIHENCLSTWVTMSQKHVCEICKEEYQQSGSQFKPIKDWAKPKFGSKEALSLLLLFSLCFCIVYLVLLFAERHFIERVYEKDFPCRSDDLARIVILVLMSTSFIASATTVAGNLCLYLKKQKEIRFINKRQSTA